MCTPSTPITLTIADSAQMEKVFVELSSPYEAGKSANFDWGIVSQDTLPLRLILYSRPDGEPMVLDLDEVIEALQRAKQCLLGSAST
jgi:hypothetical protein